MGAAALPIVGTGAFAAEPDPLPSWNDGPAKRAILEFVRATTDAGSPQYVAPEDRFVAFDQDGTTWVEHPNYTQLAFAFDRAIDLAPQHPAWQTTEPFESLLARDREAIARFTSRDLEAIVAATHTGMPVESFTDIARSWIAKAHDSRWHRHYTELVYQPMLELMRYLRSGGYRTYIVTGGGQDFVRSYSESTYGVPADRVIGSAAETQLTYARNGDAVLIKQPKLLLNNNMSGKAEDIYLFTGHRPRAAFGNSTGDRQMLEYTGSGGGARLMMLVLHDDANREYAYGPATGLPDTKIGTFTQALYDEAKAKGWHVISMKNDWRRIFAFQ